VYLPKHFTARDRAAVEAFVDGVAAADLVTFDGTKPVASLIPIIWDRPAVAAMGSSSALRSIPPAAARDGIDLRDTP
jgi:predicted FMN-binding regulatory protein PaiB